MLRRINNNVTKQRLSFNILPIAILIRIGNIRWFSTVPICLFETVLITGPSHLTILLISMMYSIAQLEKEGITKGEDKVIEIDESLIKRKRKYRRFRARRENEHISSSQKLTLQLIYEVGQLIEKRQPSINTIIVIIPKTSTLPMRGVSICSLNALCSKRYCTTKKKKWR